MQNQMNGVSTPYARNLTIVKGFFKKPLVLVFGLISLASLICSIIYQSKVYDLVQNFINKLYSLMEKSGTLNSYVETYNFPKQPPVFGFGAGDIVAFLITGVTVLCFFMIYFFSHTSNPSISPYLPFKILHIFSVVELVLGALGGVILLIFTVVLAFSSASAFQGTAGSELGTYFDAFKVTIIVFMIIVLAVYVLYLFFLNSQTAFLKSCERSCNEPMIQKKGAKTYGTLSIIFGVISMVGVVLSFLSKDYSVNSIKDAIALFIIPITGNSEELADALSPLSTVMTIASVSSMLTALSLFVRGIIARGYHNYASENAEYVYAAASAARRAPEANPIATYKADQRVSNNAIHQSQPYLYGEEEENNNEPKKSQYIPKELQEDYPQQQQFDPQQQPFGVPMQFDPQFNQPDPYGMPQQDPYMQPMMGGNPYGGQPVQNPDSPTPYNNGMM